MDPDAAKVGRAFSSTAIEMVLASYPGLFTISPPGEATSFGVFWPALVPAELDPPRGGDGRRARLHRRRERRDHAGALLRRPGAGPGRRSPPGRRPGLRWAPSSAPARATRAATPTSASGPATDDAFAWLDDFLTVERLAELAPTWPSSTSTATASPNLRALNFIVVGLLGRGVAASTRIDPQAKGLGEYLRAKVVDVPLRLMALPPPPSAERPGATPRGCRSPRQCSSSSLCSWRRAQWRRPVMLLALDGPALGVAAAEAQLVALAEPAPAPPGSPARPPSRGSGGRTDRRNGRGRRPAAAACRRRARRGGAGRGRRRGASSWISSSSVSWWYCSAITRPHDHSMSQ